MGGTACFKRSGAATVPMSIEEIRDLLSAARPAGYDESVLSEVEVERLDWSRMKAAMPSLPQESDLNSNRIKAVLVDNGLASDVGGRLHPTVAGWLIFGNNPQSVRQFRNASIEFQVFRGITRAEPIKKVEIKGVLPDQIVQAVSVLLQHLWVMPTIVGVRREEIPSYDESILREALTNALVHRDYTKMHQPVKAALFTDRLEIENPGGLMPGLTTMNLVHKRSWRNPLLAERMKKYGHGEMDGQGIDRIYAATRAIHLPAPIFQVSPEAFTVVLSGPKHFSDYTPEEKRQTVIVMMILAATIDNESVRQAFGIGMQAASTLLKAMVEEGIVEAVGKGKRFVKYRLTAVYRDRVFG